jgi:tRNA pseudouridine55 synthase
MQGLLLVDKPTDWTSFDVVNYVRGTIARSLGVKPKSIKVGHIGTLDPLATGLLVLLIGQNYTRRASELSQLDKVYEVTMNLGFISSTGDDEGEKQPVSNREPEMIEITKSLKLYTGDLKQVPPAFSAIKVQGQRAYKLARAGQVVELEPRSIKIYSNKLKGYVYPKVEFTSSVSSGTYIRALVEDVGKELGTGAYMSELRRTSIGQFLLKNALPVQNLSADLIAASLQSLD